MGRDPTYTGTTSELTGLKRYMSGWDIAETAGTTAVVKLRDSIALPTAPSAVDGAAGSVTTGLHMLAVTWVTRHGESLQGPMVEFTAAGSKHATITIPTGPTTRDTTVQSQASGVTGLPAIRDIIVGRRIYATKAAAPATGVTPTNAQWFLILADLSTTLTSAMNNLPLSGNASLTVASTTGFAAAGNILVTTTSGVQPVAYTSVDATHFLGCSMLRPSYTGGYMATSGAVTQPMVGDNTSTTYDWNIADGSLAATQPPLKDTAGHLLAARVTLSANQTAGNTLGPNVAAAMNNGGVYVEVTSGAVEWEIRGQ